MATADNKRYLRYMLLLQDGGTLILKGLIKREELKEGKTLSQILTDNNDRLRQLIRNDRQYEYLFPSAGQVNSDLDTWDISLLSFILLNIFGSKLTSQECNDIKTIHMLGNESDSNVSLLNLFIRFNNQTYGNCLELINTMKPPTVEKAIEAQLQRIDQSLKKFENGGKRIQLVKVVTAFLSHFEDNISVTALERGSVEQSLDEIESTHDSASSCSEPDINDLLLDPNTLKQYNLALKEGKDEDKTIRVMIIGCHGQGKTTLARRLLGQTLDGIESTHGIEIYKAVCPTDVCKWNCDTDENIQVDTIKRLARIQVEVKKEAETKDNQQQSDKIDNRSDKIDNKSDKTNNTSDNIDNNYLLPRLSDDSRDDTLKDKGVARTDNGQRLNELSDRSIGDEILTDNRKQSQVFRQRSSQKKADMKLFLKYKRSMPEEERNNEKISLWDFGGQFVFYATHQLFHSRNAVYLLVFDLHKVLESKVLDEDYPDEIDMKTMKDYIEFWVTSVHSYVGSKDAAQPKIILVGTHKDKLTKENEAERYFESVRKLFNGRKMMNHIHSESFAISATDLSDDTVDQLRATIMSIGRKKKRVVPARWLPLEMELKMKQQLEKVNIMNFKEVIEINEVMDHPLKSIDEIKSFLRFHHATGAFVYFDEGEMAQYVILNPQYIIDAFKCIITSGKFCKMASHLKPLWEQLTGKAILKEELVNAVWENDTNDGGKCNFKHKNILLSVLQKHRIIARAHTYDEDLESLTPQDYYIVPSFLRKAKNREIENFLAGRNYTGVSLVYVFNDEAIVPTIFQRVSAAAVGSLSVIDFRGHTLLFENAGVFRMKKNHAGVISRSGETIELLVVNLCTDKIISAEIPNFLRRLVVNVIKNEFQKLLLAENEFPFSTAVRCYNKCHSFEGSKARYDLDLEELKSQQEKSICCPDNEAHESIDIESIRNEWFKNDLSEKKIPKRKLSSQEYVQLSRAFGEEWKNLGLFLGLDNVTIQQIVMDNIKTASRIYAMFLEWENRNSDEATLDVLVKAIEKLPRHTINFDIVNNIIDSVYN